MIFGFADHFREELMQTLQEVLQAADTAELVAALKRRFPVDLAELPAELTVAAAQAHVD